MIERVFKRCYWPTRGVATSVLRGNVGQFAIWQFAMRYAATCQRVVVEIRLQVAANRNVNRIASPVGTLTHCLAPIQIHMKDPLIHLSLIHLNLIHLTLFFIHFFKTFHSFFRLFI